ncbi:hypothetical protein EYF80_027883 [Liparis tanakae]|uniref:Uncharacterized protein n=1 Tax=Liparis tanakae TaxID=230148 RepID=A0A4Z2H7I1_9TELE|nr:hypothetical protein EYF80_027883 [Liparis tanakae]
MRDTRDAGSSLIRSSATFPHSESRDVRNTCLREDDEQNHRRRDSLAFSLRRGRSVPQEHAKASGDRKSKFNSKKYKSVVY